jgi:hypothetical protein
MERGICRYAWAVTMTGKKRSGSDQRIPDPVVLVVPLGVAGVGAVVARAVPATQSTTTRNTLRKTRRWVGG